MNKDKLLTIRVTEEEIERIKQLAGSDSMSEFAVERIFSAEAEEPKDMGSYPGWTIMDGERRDKGIKIFHANPPMGTESPRILYPEDPYYDKILDE